MTSYSDIFCFFFPETAVKQGATRISKMDIMEDDGRKAETSQSPNHSNNGSNVHNEKKEIQVFCNIFPNVKRWIEEFKKWLKIMQEAHLRSCSRGLTSLRNILVDQNTDLYGIKASAFQSRNFSDKGSNVHNERKEIQVFCDIFPTVKRWIEEFKKWDFKKRETLLRWSTSRRKIVKDQNKDQYGIKASAFQSLIHSDKGSNVHNEVTDTPEVLDTHLTKEDVDSKVPQNNWREGIFSLRWKHLSVHQVIVVFLLMTSFTQGKSVESESQDAFTITTDTTTESLFFTGISNSFSDIGNIGINSHCETSQTMNCSQLFLTCSFDTDINQLAKNLYMNHVQNNSSDLEIILSCQRSSKGFKCETIPTYEFVSIESNRLTVKIPEINLEHVGKYWCNMHGFDVIKQKDCQLPLPDTSSEDCFEQENGSSRKDYRLSPGTIASIVFSILLVICVTSQVVIYFRSSLSAKYIAICINLENCNLGRSAPTANTREECENL